MFAAAHTGERPPWELVEAQMCELLHKLPSEIKDEPADDLMRFWRLRNLFWEHYNPKAHER